MDDKVFNEIINFVYEQRWKYRKKLTRHTTLEKDLKITGDDGVEFLDAFFEQFGIDVDYSSLNYHKYFDPEGFDPVGLSWLIGKNTGKTVQVPPIEERRDLSLGDLEEAVKQRRWIY